MTQEQSGQQSMAKSNEAEQGSDANREAQVDKSLGENQEAPTFSLSRFETACYARKHEPAAREFLILLEMLDRNYGGLDRSFVATPTANMQGGDQDPHIINRICSALSALFSDPEFNLSFQGFRQMLFMHRWIATLFAASSFRNADHILRSLNLKGPDASEVEFRQEDVVKFCLLYTPNSEVPIEMDALWGFNKDLAAALGCALISPRFLGTPAAHYKREVLLNWLPAKLLELDDLDVLPTAVLHDVYMHCSYAALPHKHAIKKSINALVRRKLESNKIHDVVDRRPKRDKPVMLVLLEWFSGAHSIYRTHSASLQAARALFTVIGIGNPHQVDDAGREVFDQFIEAEGDFVKFVRDKAEEIQADIVYYPAFGMFPYSIFLSNLRLAPVQVVSYGHPATSMSSVIDFFVLPEDWVGDPMCFSEELIPLPAEAMPFVPTKAAVPVSPIIRDNPEVVDIVVAATTMKQNPLFLQTLQRIQNESPKPLRYHFFMGAARGLVYLEVRQFIHAYLPDAKIYTHLPYKEYIVRLNQCDMYLNPFPFGNTNGIVDVTSVGLVGVCKTGPEVLEHIDEALFRRIGLPDWLIAKTVDEYVAAAVRLVNENQLRKDFCRKLLEEKAHEVFFRGDGKGFAEVLLTKLLPAGK